MDVEFEEFDTVEEIFLYMACVASPMKNILTINSKIILPNIKYIRNLETINFSIVLM